TLTITPAADHWLTLRIDAFRLETVTPKADTAPDGEPLLVAEWRGRRMTVASTRKSGRGRIVELPLAGDDEAAKSPEGERLVHRSIRWASGRDQSATHRAAVVGYGGSFNMGKVHADGIRVTPGLQLSAICDSDPARAEQARRDFPDLPAYTDLGKL